MTRRAITRAILITMAVALTGTAIASLGVAPACRSEKADDSASTADSVCAPTGALAPDSLGVAAGMPPRYSKLTDADFARVAAELGVEPAAIKAVVRIEAGAAMEGFWAPGVPIINPDRSLYNRYGRTAKNRAGNKSAKVPPGLKGIAHRRWQTLTNWRHTNAEGADMGTLWGMFQIGGFAYKACGCQSIGEFVKRMSESEAAQLDLFANLVKSTGYVKYIRNKDWAGFARRYNGPSYARRGYHTKMARAYAKFKK